MSDFYLVGMLASWIIPIGIGIMIGGWIFDICDSNRRIKSINEEIDRIEKKVLHD